MARVGFISLFLVLSSVISAPVHGQRVRELPGRIEDGNLHEPLRAAVAAYTDSRNEREGQCPAFDDLINRVESDSDGRFSIPIPIDSESFTAVVCKAGYFPRIEPAIQNSDRSRFVLPLPIELVSYHATSSDLEVMTEERLRRFDRDLAYLRSVDGGPQAIEVAIGRIVAVAEEAGRTRWANALRTMMEYLVEGEGLPIS